MLSLELTDFMVQLKDGTINNIGGPTKAATVKLFDVDEASARAFGDNRIKIIVSDESGNDIEVALTPDRVDEIEADIASIRAEGTVSGLESTPN